MQIIQGYARRTECENVCFLHPKYLILSVQCAKKGRIQWKWSALPPAYLPACCPACWHSKKWLAPTYLPISPPTYLPPTCTTANRSWAADHPANFYKHHSLMEANRLYLLIYMALVVAFICLLVTRDSVYSMWSIRCCTHRDLSVFSRVGDDDDCGLWSLGSGLLNALKQPEPRPGNWTK